MSEANPLNDFLDLEEAEPANSLFADISFPEIQEALTPTAPPAIPPVAEIPAVPELPKEEPRPPQASLFAEALAQTPAAPIPAVQAPMAQVPMAQAPAVQPPAVQPAAAAEPEEEDPFAAALKKARENSESRLAGSFAEKEAVFSYGKAKDPISERDCTFEDLRLKYEADFPELSDSKKVSWTVLYGKTTKSITNPGSDKVYDIKAEIEKSKPFLDNIKKAKTDEEKQPECLVKPRVVAQSKGDVRMPSYKDYCSSEEEARASDKPIVLLPSWDGRIYEMRKTPVGNFTAPAEFLPEFPSVEKGFQMALPKIPMHILMFILNFFEKLSGNFELEALVHILYDTLHGKYTMRVPKQELTHVSVHSVLEEEYPEHLIHVMDIHSHNTMPAMFSSTDDEDETATRLYAVAGRLDRVFPDIAVRASCAGKFIYLRPEEVFETNFKAYPYPSVWDEQITVQKPEKRPLPPMPEPMRMLGSGRKPDEIL